MPIGPIHAAFYSELTQTPQWIANIGARNTATPQLAAIAIQTIIDNQNAYCWVIQWQNQIVGICTLLKRNYLPFFDLGFALLPAYYGKGIAFNASALVIQWAHQNLKLSTLIAISSPNNLPSIRLLSKLGFQFQEILEVGNEQLNLYQKKLP